MIRKGRFNKLAAKIAQRYGESVSFDWRLYRHDIAGSIAHAAALARAGISSADELRWRHIRKATGDGCAVTGQHQGADSALALGFGPHR
jgi:argininosuccinate lyase